LLLSIRGGHGLIVHREAVLARPRGCHTGGMSTEQTRPGIGSEPAVLDIGGDIGALVLLTDAEYEGREIEVSRLGEDDHRVHTAIHRRPARDAVTYAGVYPQLVAGPYRIWADRPGLTDEVTIVGGQVAEVDWRRPKD
jgi:hypothetical protein